MRRIVVAVTTLLALSVLAAGCGGSTSSPAAKPPARHVIAHGCAGNICTVPISEEKVPTATQLASLCNYSRVNSIAPVDATGLEGQISELIVVCENGAS
jgi:nitrous oxide reductase accessory protein NosL